MKTNAPHHRGNLRAMNCILSLLTLGLLVAVPSTVCAQPEPPVAAARQVAVYRLTHADASLVHNVAAAVLSGEDVVVTIEPVSNSLIVSGSAEQLKKVVELIQQLDVRVAEERERVDAADQPTYRVRVVWLMSGLQEGGHPLPADMVDVAEQLQRLGFDSPVKMIGQTMLAVSAESPFTMSGVAQFDRTSEMVVMGLIPTRRISDQVFLELHIRCDEIGAHGPLANLETQITASLGEYLVLGISPAHQHTSAFVIQVVRVP